MLRGVWLTMIVAACAASPSGPSLVGPIDGGPVEPGDAGPGRDGGPIDGSVMAPDDPPDSTDLAVLCGAVPTTFDQWEDCYRKRKCQFDVGCFPTYPFRDVADCVAAGDAVSGGQQSADRRERKRALDEGRATLNVAAFTQCLIRTSASRCNTAFYDPACLTRYTGTVADNGSCLTDIDCASPDATCTSTCHDACCAGTCQPKFRLGEACLKFASCEPGLRCNGITCVSGDIGSSCPLGSVNWCDFGTFCDPKTLRCTPTLALGATCTELLQCGGNMSCVGTSIVNSDPGHCLRIAKPGDRCDDQCFGDLYCDRATDTCHSLPTLNQSCSALVPCAGSDLMCNSSRICVLRSNADVSCGGQSCMPGLFCTTELGDPPATAKCAARRGVGGTCTAPSHCESFLCSGTAGQPGMCLAWSDTCP